MAWVNPGTRTTGDLITAAIWTQDVQDNTNYLKGRAGTIELEAGVISDTDVTDDLGSAAVLWKDIHGRTVYGSRMRVNPNIREVRITWEDDAFANIQVATTATGGGSTISNGGTGQMVMKVDNDAGGARSCEIEQTTEQNNSLDNAWTVSKQCYFRFEFSLNAEDVKSGCFFGFRAVPVITIPTGTEIHAGLLWDGGAWQLATGDGTTSSLTQLTTDPTAGSRNVVEIYVNSTTNVELWLNGVKQITKTTNKPTGAMDWQILLETTGDGSGDSILTVGQVLMQETTP